MKIKEWLKPEEQYCFLGNESWSVARLFELSRSLPVMEIPLDHLCLSSTYDNLNLRDIVMHMTAVSNANLDNPIILSENGDIMDGRHRIMRALYEGKPTIKAVRFDENPEPCRKE